MSSHSTGDGHVAYFTMEIGLENALKTYYGGLGILAGDVMRAFADMDVDAVGVTLLNDLGLGRQYIDEHGMQTTEPDEWDPEEHLTELDATATVPVGDEEVTVGAWRYDVDSEHGGTAPVVFLDTNREGNSDWARSLSRHVYGAHQGGEAFKVAQEIILGIGGVRVLDALGYDVDTYHMNEGHASFMTLELLKRNDMDPDAVREQCIFTTHTPVAAAHETFDYGLIDDLLGDFVDVDVIREYSADDVLHTTLLALNLTRYVNGVAKRHQLVSQEMFPEHADKIDAITNGAHVPTWVGEHMQRLFDEYMPRWKETPEKLRHAMFIDDDDLWAAHQAEKRELIEYVRERSGVELDPDVLTLGFARRAVPYKRAPLLFDDVDRLRQIVDDVGDVQIVYAGKAFPGDGYGIGIIQEIYDYMEELEGEVTITYLENYDMEMGAKLTAGVDVWLNNPRRPREACGTSGMKAAFNGVPQFSTLDGWWVEGHIEGETGWKIGPEPFTEEAENLSDEEEDYVDAESLYDQLENAVLPTYYEDREKWVDIMRNAIAVNGAQYHAKRMMQEYLSDAYDR